MEEVSLQAKQIISNLTFEMPTETSNMKTTVDGQNGNLEGNSSDAQREFIAPVVGMEFDSYDDAYNYYSCYAKEAGFSVRVKNSWFKRNSREKYGAVLCCSSQGFKRVKDVNRLRKETRTGCPAMMRIRLSDFKRWRIIEVTHEHNHLLGKSSKKRKFSSVSDLDVQPVKLYRPLVIERGGGEMSNFNQPDPTASVNQPDQLNMKKGDMQAIYNYLCRLQLTNPNFYYLMDISNDGLLRNVFWMDARARASREYFGDVIFFDNSCLSNKYETPLVTFVSVNQHGQFVLLGCGLLSSETMESYTWILKVWLNSSSVNYPKTIITDQCTILQSAVADVFPNSVHRFGLSHIIRKVPEKLGGLRNYDAIRKTLLKGVYEGLKPYDFESAWGFMIQRFGVADNEWLRLLYEDRTKWAPVYLKDTAFMGMAAARPGETLNAFFNKYLHKQTPLKEFLDKYELALHRKYKEEVNEDMESRISRSDLKTRCSFELQLSRIYTRAIFKKFQSEVEEMYSCFSTTQVHVDGTMTIFLVKERVLGEGNRRDVRDYEVLYDRAAAEVRCICSCFNFYGYLCRHALCVLNFNGVEEIPSKYILSRWKKDFRQSYICDDESGEGETSERVRRFTELYRSVLQVVEKGVISLDHYKFALASFEECLDRIHSLEGKL